MRNSETRSRKLQQGIIFHIGEETEITTNIKRPSFSVWIRGLHEHLSAHCLPWSLLSINSPSKALTSPVSASLRMRRRRSSAFAVHVLIVMVTSHSITGDIARGNAGGGGGGIIPHQSLLWKPILTHGSILRPRSPLAYRATLIKSPNLWH